MCDPVSRPTRLVRMKGADGAMLIYLVCVLSLGTAGRLETSPDDLNGTQASGEEEEEWRMPVVLTTPSQIIAREGNCVLIDCNVTGEPFPKVRWFNSHGHLLDTEENGKLDLEGFRVSEGLWNGAHNTHTQLNHFHVLK